MKYFIRTTNDRELDKSYNQIPYELIVDKDYKPIDSFIKALYQINDEDSFLLEDDLILCNDFIENSNKAIEAYPGRIINFFQSPPIYQPIKETYIIQFNQCTFYPKGIAKQIADIMINEPRKEGSKRNMYSLLEQKALKELDVKVVQYRPHLVQHLDTTTLLFDNPPIGWRRSLYFIDYLKELGITYEEASSYRDKLIGTMRKHFKKILQK